MNRRLFLTNLFTILPATTQYKRVWKALDSGILVRATVPWTEHDAGVVYIEPSLEEWKAILERRWREYQDCCRRAESKILWGDEK